MADRHDGHEDDDERKVRKGPVLVSTLLGGEESWRLRDTCSVDRVVKIKNAIFEI